MIQTLDDLKRIDALCRRKFTYFVNDFELYHWRSHGDAVIAGEAWRDCCSGLTSTVLDLITREGFPLEDSYRLLVSLESTRAPDHMVGAVSFNGEWYVVGDTTHTIYSATGMPHKKFFYNRLTEAMPPNVIWRIGVPWEIQNVST